MFNGNFIVLGAIGNGIETANQILPLLNKEKFENTPLNSPTPDTERGRSVKSYMDHKPTKFDIIAYKTVLKATQVVNNVEITLEKLKGLIY